MNVGILIAYILIELVKNFRKTWLNPDFTLQSLLNEHARVRFLEVFAALLAHFQPALLRFLKIFATLLIYYRLLE